MYATLPSDRPTLLAVAGMPVLPVNNGYSLRVANVLRALSADWRIVLAAPLGGTTPEQVAQLGVGVVIPLPQFRGWEAPLAREEREAVQATMRSLTQQYAPTAAIIWPGAEVVLASAPTFPPALLDRLDSEVVITWRELRFAAGVKGRLRAVRALLHAARAERKLVHQGAGTVVDCPLDAKVLRMLGGGDRVHVVPNGLEVGGYLASESRSATPIVAFSGSLEYSANVDAVLWFARHVWPTIHAAIPAAQFVVAGRSPVPEITALGSRVGVIVLGDIADMRATLASAWLAVAPVRTGSGIRTKVLEAWAVGRPVVLSSVAANGLPADDAVRSLVAHSANHMSELVISLLNDPARCARLGEAAHAIATRDFAGWANPGRRLSGLLRNISESAAAART